MELKAELDELEMAHLELASMARDRDDRARDRDDIERMDFEAAEVTTAGMRDLETALALATHQCAALAAGVEATVGQAIADLTAAVASAELRLESAAARAVSMIERATLSRTD